MLPGPPLLDLGQQLAAALVEAQELFQRLGGAAARQRGPGGLGILADAPKVEHRWGGWPPRALAYWEPDPVPGCGVSPASEPAYLETNFATLVASWPVRMFWGMIAPENPPFRIANRTSSKLSLRWSRLGPSWRSDRLAVPWVPAGVRVWQPEQRSENRTAPR